MRHDSLKIATWRTRAAAVLAVAAGAAVLSPAVASAQAPGVAFTSFRDGAARVYAVNADGSNPRPLTQTRRAAFEGSPAYSPDGRRIAYTCGNFELCVMNSDGSGQARLTTSDWPRTFRYDTSPAWSPDGASIAFARTVAGRDGIWIVNTDGSGLRELPVPAGVNGNPSFSPDSRTIAFDHAEDETGDDDVPSSSDSGIYAIGSDGSGLRRLTGPRIDASDPAWAPDGRHIAFARSSDESGSQIVVMNADGSGQQRVTSRSTSAVAPAWSPDSTRIAFSAMRAGAPSPSLYHVAATGGRPIRLTTGRGAALDPAWQPSAATTAAQQVTPPAGPPSVATADARAVGLLLRTFASLVTVFGSIERERAADLLSASRTMAGFARRIRTAALALRPATASGRRVRRSLLDSMSVMKGIAAETRQWSRSVRRHDRRAARRHRNDAVLGIVFGVALTLGAGAGDAGISQVEL